MKYPRGKASLSDEGVGQLRIAVLPNKKTLVIDFVKPVYWIGFGKAELLAFVETLTKRAAEMVEAEKVEPFDGN